MNKNWGQPLPVVPLPVQPTSFEVFVKSLKLQPHQYKTSPELKDWVRQNKDHKYVPLDLLRAWGFTVRGD